MDNKEIEIEHRVVIDEEKIEMSKLPNEILKAMRSFNQKLDKYEETGDENLYYELQQDDVAIADNIESWIEDNESEDDDENDSYLASQQAPQKAPQQTQQQQAQQQQQAPQQQAPQQQAPQQKQQAQSLKDKVLLGIKNNVISVQDLQSIIGREPDYPTEKINDLVLRKQYLKPFYEVV
jgi:hypothetical protein